MLSPQEQSLKDTIRQARIELMLITASWIVILTMFSSILLKALQSTTLPSYWVWIILILIDIPCFLCLCYIFITHKINENKFLIANSSSEQV